jgi:hypothetical protein
MIFYVRHPFVRSNTTPSAESEFGVSQPFECCNTWLTKREPLRDLALFWLRRRSGSGSCTPQWTPAEPGFSVIPFIPPRCGARMRRSADWPKLKTNASRTWHKQPSVSSNPPLQEVLPFAGNVSKRTHPRR